MDNRTEPVTEAKSHSLPAAIMYLLFPIPTHHSSYSIYHNELILLCPGLANSAITLRSPLGRHLHTGERLSCPMPIRGGALHMFSMPPSCSNPKPDRRSMLQKPACHAPIPPSRHHSLCSATYPHAAASWRETSER